MGGSSSALTLCAEAQYDDEESFVTLYSTFTCFTAMQYRELTYLAIWLVHIAFRIDFGVSALIGYHDSLYISVHPHIFPRFVLRPLYQILLHYEI